MTDHPMPGQDSQSETASTSFIFNPPPGGDMSVRSCDGQVFCVHSLILGLASSVFSDMSAIGTRATEVIDLAEDSETFSIMLAYIYPSGIPPPLGSFELLEKSLRVAQKYDLKAMLERLDRALSTESSYKELIESDPLLIFHLSVTYGLRQSQTVAIREVQPQHCNLLSIGGIVQLAKTYPSSSHVIALMGVQTAWAEILSRFCYDLGYYDDLVVCNTTPADENSWLICKDCRAKIITNFTPPVYYYPSWLNSWAHSLYERLIDTPRGDHSHFFTPGMFNASIPLRNTPFCKLCVKVALKAKNGQVLEAWLRNVKDKLEVELKQLDVLFTL